LPQSNVKKNFLLKYSRYTIEPQLRDPKTLIPLYYCAVQSGDKFVMDLFIKATKRMNLLELGNLPYFTQLPVTFQNEIVYLFTKGCQDTPEPAQPIYSDFYDDMAALCISNE
jgi:hypothetical protein